MAAQTAGMTDPTATVSIALPAAADPGAEAETGSPATEPPGIGPRIRRESAPPGIGPRIRRVSGRAVADRHTNLAEAATVPLPHAPSSIASPTRARCRSAWILAA